MQPCKHIQPCIMKNREIYWKRYQMQETLYIGQWHLSTPQHRYLGTSHSSPSVSSTVQNSMQNPVLELPSAVPSYFPKSYQWSEISSLSKVNLVLGKARSHRAPNLGCTGAESPGWFDLLQKNFAWDLMYEWVCCHDEAANHQSADHSCSLLNSFK